MEPLMAITIGGLFACGLYLMLQRSLMKLILGIVLLSHAANLFLFIAGGMERGKPPFIPADAKKAPAGAADPLPQALILTAIVISFGVLAFALVLVRRAYQRVGADDSDELTQTDRE